MYTRLSKLQMTEEAQRKESQLQEKREQVLLAKSEVDRVTGELMETRQMAQSLRSQLDSAMVCAFHFTDLCTAECGPLYTGRAARQGDSVTGTGEVLLVVYV